MGYGASYYSYLYARAISCSLWRDFFAKNPFSCAHGEIVGRDLLASGGLLNQGSLELTMGHVVSDGWAPGCSRMLEEIQRMKAAA